MVRPEPSHSEDMYESTDSDSGDSDSCAMPSMGSNSATKHLMGGKSVDAWGNKKMAFYGSRADEDWGGWNEKDADVLELEEQDAIARQKKFDEAAEKLDIGAMLDMEDDIPMKKRRKNNAPAAPKYGVSIPTRKYEDDSDDDELMRKQSGDFNSEGGIKRKITYEMQKNRGLTVKRKKDISHSRLKKRRQYKKALHVRRSQIPDIKRETTKYDGEARGIRASTVRSIKLKA